MDNKFKKIIYFSARRSNTPTSCLQTQLLVTIKMSKLKNLRHNFIRINSYIEAQNRAQNARNLRKN